MTIRHLLALVAGILISTSAAQAENLNWNSRKIQLTVQRDHSDAPVPTGISVRRGTEEIAVVGDDHLVRIKNRTTGRLIRLLENHSDWIKIAKYHPDGKTLYTAGTDRSIIAWNADNSHDYSRFAREDRAIEGLAIDPQGDYLATVGFNNKLNLYQLSDRKLIRTLDCPCSDMRAIQFSPNGDILAVAGRNGTIRAYRVNDGTVICDVKAHRKRVRDLIFAGNQTIVTCSDDMTLCVTDLASKKSNTLLQENTKFYCLAYLGSNQIAVGSSDNLIRVLNIRNKNEIVVLKGHTGTVCELTSDGSELISGSFDTEVRVWQIESSFVSAPKARVSRRPAMPESKAAKAKVVESKPFNKSVAKPVSSFQSTSVPKTTKPSPVVPQPKVDSSKDSKPSSSFSPSSLSSPSSSSSPSSTFVPSGSFVAPVNNTLPGSKSSSDPKPKTGSSFSSSQFQIAK